MKYISNYNPTLITPQFVDGLEYDIIELPWKLDVDKLQEWYRKVDSTYDNLYFSWRKEQYLKDKYHLKNIETAFAGEVGTEGRGVHDEGYHIVRYIKEQFKHPEEILVMEVSWPVEKEIPCPPKWAGREDLYPELSTNAPKRVQEKFKFGYFKELVEYFGEDILRDVSIRKHQPNAVLGKHIDGPNVQRLHIPVTTGEGAIFAYGENLEREYNLQLGKAYIINAAVPHGTFNRSGIDRSHLQSKPHTDAIVRMCNMEIVL